MITEVTLSAVILLLLCVYLMMWRREQRKLSRIPKVTPRLPFFGNIRELDLNQCHVVLTEWAQKFGPVYRLKAFDEEILVLNSFDSVHDALVVKGSAFAGRPPMYRTAKHQRDKHSIVWQTYTEKLTFLRKEVLKSLKMYGDGMDNLEHKCAPQIKLMVETMRGFGGRPFDPWDCLYEAVSNVMLGLTLDTTFDHSSRKFQMVKDINHLFNDTFGAGCPREMDFLPWLSKLGLHKYSKRLDRALSLRDVFWNEELQLLKDRSDSDCIVQRLLKLTTEPPSKLHDVTELTAKEVFTNLILAGTDTTATALTCLMLILIHKPEVQQKMWSEIQLWTGINRPVSLADRVHMPYVQAVLLELLRYTSHVPLAVPHFTTCDTSVLGIPVPKNMTVYINLWALHHDPVHWPDPWTFRPERFLDETGQLRPVTDPVRRRLMPFGAGRRVCLGEALAKNRLFLFAASLVQNFEFQPAPEDATGGVKSEGGVFDERGSLPQMDPRTYEMGLVLHPQHYQLIALARQ